MPETIVRPPFHPQSLAYGEAVMRTAGNTLQHTINTLVTGVDPAIIDEIKTDAAGATSQVTRHDRETEALIGAYYEGTDMRVRGEEGVTVWPDGKDPALDVHADPIDGTELFVEYVKELIAWMELPEENRPPRPICDAMMSAGAVPAGGGTPEWGVAVSPFMFENGLVMWSAGATKAAVRTEPDGRQYLLPRAKTITAPKNGGVVLVASDTAERLFTEPLRDLGYRVIKLKSAVAAALSVLDRGLFERLHPGVLGDDIIVGTAMRTVKNWDIAATTCLAHNLGFFVSDARGNPHAFEDQPQGMVLALSPAIGATIMSAIAPHLYTETA